MSQMVFVPRANASFPSVWLSLRWSPHSGDPADLLREAVESGLPLELSRNAALWRSGLNEDCFVLSIGGREAGVVADGEAAATLVEASLIQAACALGHTVDLFVLDVREPWTDEQLRGALAALEQARSDRMVRFFGLRCPDAGLLLRTWRNFDGFEFVLLPASEWRADVADLCRQRGAGGVAEPASADDIADCPAAIRLVPVRTPSDVQQAVLSVAPGG